MTSPPRRLTRRRLLGGALGVVAAAAAGGHYWRRRWHPMTGDLAAFLRQRLGHLNLDPGAIDQFAAEYVTRYGAQVMGAYSRDTFGGLFGTGALGRLLPTDRRRRVLAFERRTISYFLRSTNYFQAPAGSVVRFVAFPDPYERPCPNPFRTAGADARVTTREMPSVLAGLRAVRLDGSKPEALLKQPR